MYWAAFSTRGTALEGESAHGLRCFSLCLYVKPIDFLNFLWLVASAMFLSFFFLGHGNLSDSATCLGLDTLIHIFTCTREAQFLGIRRQQFFFFFSCCWRCFRFPQMYVYNTMLVLNHHVYVQLYVL